MRHRRLFIGLLSAGTFLVQALGAAWAMPHPKAAAPAEAQAVPATAASAMPCHGEAAADPADGAVTERSTTCCAGDTCACDALCGGAAMSSATARTTGVTPDRAMRVALAAAALPPHSLTPLRPPITSHR